MPFSFPSQKFWFFEPQQKCIIPKRFKQRRQRSLKSYGRRWEMSTGRVSATEIGGDCARNPLVPMDFNNDKWNLVNGDWNDMEIWIKQYQTIMATQIMKLRFVTWVWTLHFHKQKFNWLNIFDLNSIEQ
jgi:hypothetical protein